MQMMVQNFMRVTTFISITHLCKELQMRYIDFIYEAYTALLWTALSMTLISDINHDYNLQIHKFLGVLVTEK
jgi:hypothetical protein